MTDNELLKLAIQYKTEFENIKNSRKFVLDFDIVDCMWFKLGNDTVYYNTDNNLDDLLNESNNSYESLYYNGPHYEDDEFFMIYSDTQTGYMFYQLFYKKNLIEIDEDKFLGL